MGDGNRTSGLNDPAPLGYDWFSSMRSEISKYIEAAGIFSLLLKSGDVIHYIPQDKCAFRKWLYFHGITDVKGEHCDWRFPRE